MSVMVLMQYINGIRRCSTDMTVLVLTRYFVSSYYFDRELIKRFQMLKTKVVVFLVLFVHRAHSPDCLLLSLNLQPVDNKTRALTIAPSGDAM